MFIYLHIYAYWSDIQPVLDANFTAGSGRGRKAGRASGGSNGDLSYLTVG